MILIVGLGNPGKKYDDTRHNVGFDVIEAIARHKEHLSIDKETVEFEKSSKFRTEIYQTRLNGEEFILAKPSTFMNNSGQSVASIANFYKIEPKKIWIISDDIDICLGQIRIRHGGSSGGHKGLEDIIQKLGDSSFTRIRVGIAEIEGDPRTCREPGDAAETKEYVLGKFSPREKAVLKNIIQKAADYIVQGIKKGFLKATTVKVTEKDKP